MKRAGLGRAMGVVLALAALPAMAAANVQQFSHGRFEQIPVHMPAGTPQRVVIWFHQPSAAPAAAAPIEALRADGALVASVDVDHLRGRLEENLPTEHPCPPAYVDILDVKEVALVEPVQCVEIAASHGEAGARHRGHLDDVVRRSLTLPVHLIAPQPRQPAGRTGEGQDGAHRRDIAASGATLL